jgi:hypothetical protein
MVLLTALLVPMFALALQSEKRAELANEKIDSFFTRNGLFIFSQQQQWRSACHSSRVVQDPRHFFRAQPCFFEHPFVT